MNRTIAALLALAAVSPLGASTQAPLLTASTPILVTRTSGNGFFDYLTIDAAKRRLLAVHSSAGTLEIINVDSGRVERSVGVGTGHGVAVDARDGEYLVGTDEATVAVVDRKTLAKRPSIRLPGPADDIEFDPRNRLLYVDSHEETGADIWVIDPRRAKVVATMRFGPKLEFLQYDPVSDRLYQNVQGSDRIAVIDPNRNSVERWWPLPVHHPAGLAVDAKRQRVFSIGAHGRLAVLDESTGKVLNVVRVVPRVDQIAADPTLARLYVPSVTGKLSVVKETNQAATREGIAPIPTGAHTLAIDAETHAVWIAYGAADGDYVLKLALYSRE